MLITLRPCWLCLPKNLMFNCVTNICNLDLRLQCPKRLKCSHFTPSWPTIVCFSPIHFQWDFEDSKCQCQSTAQIKYSWWKKSCTSWYGESAIIYRVISISGGAGFLPSTVPPASLSLGAAQTLQISSPSTDNRQGPDGELVALKIHRLGGWGGVMEGIWKWGVSEEAYLGGGFKYVVFSSRTLGKRFNLTSIFRWVETTN